MAVTQSDAGADHAKIEMRTKSALEECMAVTPEIGQARGVDGWAIVTSESGRELLVDIIEGACWQKNGEICPDQKYNLGSDGECKHVRRAKIAMGSRPITTGELVTVDVDPDLGQHASGPTVVTSDGNIVQSETDS